MRCSRRQSYDLVVAVFAEAHTGGHQAWEYRRDAKGDGPRPDHGMGDALLRLYRAVDDEIGRIVDALPPTATVVVTSSVGMLSQYPIEELLEDFCRRLGYQASPQPAASSGPPPRRSITSMLRSLVPERARNLISRFLPFDVQARLMSEKFASSTDWSRTTAYAPPGYYTGCIRVNLRGREPNGIVAPGAEYDALLSRLEEDLHALRDAETGAPVIARTVRTREAFGDDGAPRASRPHRVLERARSSASARSSSSRGADAGATRVHRGSHQPRKGCSSRRQRRFARRGDCPTSARCALPRCSRCWRRLRLPRDDRLAAARLAHAVVRLRRYRNLMAALAVSSSGTPQTSSVAELVRVVLVAGSGPAGIARTMRHLGAQTARRRMEVLVVAESSAGFDLAALGGGEFAACRIVEMGPITERGAAAAIGMRAATSPTVVGLIEDHSYPEPEWAEALLSAHTAGGAGVGPAVEQREPRVGGELGELHPRRTGASRRRLPGGERPAALAQLGPYKRDALAPFGDRLGALLEWEGALQAELRARGHTLYLEPAARTHHNNVSAAVVHRRPEHAARAIPAAQRAERERWPAWRRMLQAAAFPLFPLLQLRHVRLPVPSSPRPRGYPRPLGMPLGCSRAVRSLGSAHRRRAGLLAGEDDAVARMEDYELHRARASSRRASRSNGAPVPRELRATMRVLVTGATGFLGGAVARRLAARRPRRARARACDRRCRHRSRQRGSTVVRGDVRDEDAVALAVRGCSHVIHLAAAKSGALAHQEDVNVRGTRRSCWTRRARLASSVRRTAARSACTAS